MNLVLGVVAGALIGWFVFSIMRVNTEQGRLTSLCIGMVGGGLGTLIAPVVGAVPATDGGFNLFYLVIAIASAAAALIVANMIATRRSA